MRKLPYPKVDLVCVFWEDAVGESTRIEADAIHNLSVALNSNVGWIVAENDKVMRLCHGASTSGELDCIEILKANVIEILAIAPRKRTPKRTKEPGDKEAT